MVDVVKIRRPSKRNCRGVEEILLTTAARGMFFNVLADIDLRTPPNLTTIERFKEELGIMSMWVALGEAEILK